MNEQLSADKRIILLRSRARTVEESEVVANFNAANGSACRDLQDMLEVLGEAFVESEQEAGEMVRPGAA